MLKLYYPDQKKKLRCLSERWDLATKNGVCPDFVCTKVVILGLCCFFITFGHIVENLRTAIFYCSRRNLLDSYKIIIMTLQGLKYSSSLRQKIKNLLDTSNLLDSSKKIFMAIKVSNTPVLQDNRLKNLLDTSNLLDPCQVYLRH